MELVWELIDGAIVLDLDESLCPEQWVLINLLQRMKNLPWEGFFPSVLKIVQVTSSTNKIND
jgi:hypothetical protein